MEFRREWGAWGAAGEAAPAASAGRLLTLTGAPAAVAAVAMLGACASEPELSEQMQPDAVKAAQQHGSSEFACPVVSAEVVSRKTIEEPQGTGWYQPPRRAEYTVAVSGCGKQTTYLVSCDSLRKGCVAGGLPKAAGSQPDLADQLRPGAIKVAQQHGSSELDCPAATANVQREETVQEPQGTGWYEPPRRALYTIAVSGCGKSTAYLVSCEEQQKNCVAGHLQNAAGPEPRLVAELQADAVKIAQQHGATELACPAATADVLRKEIVEEPQGTGWYESPHRALYTISISGCGKSTTYLVSCDDRNKDKCTAGSLQNAAR